MARGNASTVKTPARTGTLLQMSEPMSQACERCWRRKQKCSREVPTCQQCRTASVTCVPRRFGSSASTAEYENENGIGALQRRIRSLRAQLETENRQDPTPSTSTPLEDMASDDRVVQDDVAYISLSAMAERTEHLPFPTEGLSFLTLLYSAIQASGANPTLPLGKNLSLSGSLAELRQKHLFSLELDGADMRAAFKDYVDTMRSTFPYMTKEEFHETYGNVVQSSEERAPPEEKALVFLGTATGMLLGTHYTHKELHATELAVAAIGLMPQVLDRSQRLPIVRCLIAMTIYSLYTPFGGSTWHLLGLAVTRCVSAGMHTIRASEATAENREQRENARALWALYILDTIVSATMDRPFGLNNDDIVVPLPCSPHPHDSQADSDAAIFRHVVQYAQALRSFRDSKDPAASLLCHFINVRHWNDSIPRIASLQDFTHMTFTVRAYAELLKQQSMLNDPDRPIVIAQAFREFAIYLDCVEERLISQIGAVSSLDALLIFNIGVLIAMTMQSRANNDTRNLFQVTNILTLLSARFSALRSLRDMILELQQSLSRSRSWDRLRMLVADSEVVVSDTVRNLMFGSDLDHNTINGEA